VGLSALVAGCSTDAGASLATGPRQDERDAMVSSQIEARGVDDERVLAAMRRVPRHEFVPAEWRSRAYDDRPLTIGWEQTISQPFIVAFMTEALELRGGEKVLEIGTGSGYQAAVLAALGCTVYSIEIVEPLARNADATLRRLGYEVQVRAGDGYRGWPEAAPFDAIIVTAAPERVPQPLVDQLAVGGRLVLPVGGHEQRLVRLDKTSRGVHRTELLPVRFVPMTGEVRGGR
jgi:protein-L-isoaspartate(D-aspartate) O-methyltransferase